MPTLWIDNRELTIHADRRMNSIMPGTTIWGLADGAAWPIKTVIRKFRGEFEEAVSQPLAASQSLE